MTFWLIIAVLCAASVYGLSFAFRGRNASGDLLETEKALYRSRIEEIDRDYRLGRLDEDTAKAGKTEEARRLLRLERELGPIDSNVSNSKLLLLVAMLFVPAFALPFYMAAGNPTAATDGVPALVAEGDQTSRSNPNGPTLNELVVAAERQLQLNPNDASGWRLLGPIYLRQGKLAEARAAYDNLLRLNQRDSDVLLTSGVIRMIEDEGERTEEVDQLFAEASRVDPQNQKASLLASLSDSRTDNLNVWQQVAAKAGESEPWIVFLASRMVATLEPERQIDLNAVRNMVSSLATRLEEQPDDRQGWLRLVRAYRVLGEENLAIEAYNNAKDRYRDDADYMMALSDALEQKADLKLRN